MICAERGCYETCSCYLSTLGRITSDMPTSRYRSMPFPQNSSYRTPERYLISLLVEVSVSPRRPHDDVLSCCHAQQLARILARNRAIRLYVWRLGFPCTDRARDTKRRDSGKVWREDLSHQGTYPVLVFRHLQSNLGRGASGNWGRFFLDWVSHVSLCPVIPRSRLSATCISWTILPVNALLGSSCDSTRAVLPKVQTFISRSSSSSRYRQRSRLPIFRPPGPC